MKVRLARILVMTVLLFGSAVTSTHASQLADALVVEIQCSATWPSEAAQGVTCFGLAHGAISGTDQYGRYVGACLPSCAVEASLTHQEVCGSLLDLPAFTLLWGDMTIRSIATSREEAADLTLPFAALSAGLYGPAVAVVAGPESGRGEARLYFNSGYSSSDAARGEGLGVVVPLQVPRGCGSPGVASVALTLGIVGV